STQAACSDRPTLSVSIPSMVTILVLATAEIGVEQERTGWPLTCTVHAPQRAMPQPNLVPVIPSSSRSVHNSGVSAGRWTLSRLPLMSRERIAALLSSGGPRHVARVWTVPPLGRDAPRADTTPGPRGVGEVQDESGQGDARRHPGLHGEATVR